MDVLDDPAMRRRVLPSPVGELTLVASARGLRAVLWVDDEERRVASAAGPQVGFADDAEAERNLDVAVAQLHEYFAGDRTEFDVPLDPQGTQFQLAVWKTLQTIPFGRTMSYGEQARTLGDVRKARAVGGANGRNPLSIFVPCHRVVGSNGKLTGFGGGLSAKAWLLDHERNVLAGR
jgi:methylated-DNA-[protein]-cysteine S-methyltransferase